MIFNRTIDEGRVYSVPVQSYSARDRFEMPFANLWPIITARELTNR